MKNSTLVQTIKWLIYATFFVPLVTGAGGYIFPFVFPKMIVFRSLVDVIAVGYVLLLFRDWNTYRPRFTGVTGMVFLFLFSWVLSTYLGVDAYRSVWDGNERMLGLFSLLHYLVYFVVATTIFKTKAEWLEACWWFLGAGSLVMLVGLIQVFAPTFYMNGDPERVASTLGNPIYVGGYGLFLLFLGLWLAAESRLAQSKKIWPQILGLGGSLLGIVGIFASGSRGPFLGLLVGGAVMLLLAAFLYKEYPLLKKITVGALLGLCLLVVVVYSVRETVWIKSVPIIGRLTSITLTDDNTRIMAWKIALTGWQEKPWFGWGPNNFMYVFNAHYNPRFLEIGGWGETWFDNAHNILLNTLTVQGLFGVVAYLAMFAAAFWSVWRSTRQAPHNRPLAIFIFGLLTAHLIQNIFVFENITSYLFFFFILALVSTLSSKPKTLPTTAVATKPASSWGEAMVLLVGLIIFYQTNWQPAQANHANFLALNTVLRLTDPREGVKPVDAINAYELVQKISSPHIDDSRTDFSKTVDSNMEAIKQFYGKDQALKLYTVAYEEIKKNQVLHPLDVRYHIQAAEMALTGARLTNDPKYVREAQTMLTDALAKSPQRQQIYYMLSISHIYLRDFKSAIELLKTSIAHNPRVADGWVRLAGTQIEMGDVAAGKATFEEAEKQGIVFKDKVSANLRVLAGLPTSTVIKK